MFRIGTGYDVHKLTENRDLWLGGVRIPYQKGLLGHSDADVLIHAIMDAMLGALAQGNIGEIFPDNDQKYKGISSIKLLEEVNALIAEKKYRIVNIDSTIVAEKPKLKEYLLDMRKIMSKTLDINQDQVSVKATTTEGLSFEGREEGISAQAIVLLEYAHK
ncbi:2-C-methyl-D-erythritol 2,4-cyclodiphosphate synthase [Candidatus Margulisiibacteriota bacterium]